MNKKNILAQVKFVSQFFGVVAQINPLIKGAFVVKQFLQHNRLWFLSSIFESKSDEKSTKEVSSL